MRLSAPKMAAAAFLGLALVLGAAPASAASAAPKPHVLFVLVDDLGWGEVGFNRAVPDPEVVTPNVDKLVAEGVHLTRQVAVRRAMHSRGRRGCHRLAA